MKQNPQSSNVAQNAALASVPLKVNSVGSLQINQHIGEKYQPAFAGVLFTAANPTPVTLSAGLATTYVGLCVSNPAASTKNLLLRRVSGVVMVAPAAFLAFGLITGFLAAGITVHTTPITPKASKLGGAAGLGLADSACTLVGTGANAPLWARWFSASNVTANGTQFNEDLAGGILIPPGGYAAIGANVAGPAAGFLGSIEWAEVSTTG